MSIKSQGIFSYDTKNSSTNILLCYSCLNEIPEINLYIKENRINVRVFCSSCIKEQTPDLTLKDYLTKIDQPPFQLETCSINDNHNNRTGVLYCLVCENWICKECIPFHEKVDYDNSHKTLNKKISYDIFCSNHKGDRKKKKIKKYCQKCKSNICVKCDEASHKEHNSIKLKMKKTNLSFEEINNLIKLNKEIKDKKISELDKQIEEFNFQIKELLKKIDSFTKEKENTEKAFNEIKINNEQLYTLINIVDATIELTSGYGNYNLMKTSQFLIDNLNQNLLNQTTTTNAERNNPLIDWEKQLILSLEIQQYFDI